MSVPTRIEKRFAALKEAGRGGLVTFVTAGDPDAATSAEILAALPRSGADIIELGMPFSDPMADGPVIQMSSQRALRKGASLRKTLAMVTEFRRGDDDTPIILMGYFNPIYAYGADAFAADAKAATPNCPMNFPAKFPQPRPGIVIKAILFLDCATALAYMNGGNNLLSYSA